jgi:hypothetical protein
MNPLLLVGIAINCVVTAFLAISGEYSFLWMIMAAFVGLSIVGAILIATGNRKIGAILAIIGCVPFVPIGLVGAFGARKVLDELKQDEFDKRRYGRDD